MFGDTKRQPLLWELWYQQKFSDKLDLKIGEQSLEDRTPRQTVKSAA